MKKIVMVMCFALCTTFAMAQSKHAPVRLNQGQQNVAVQKASQADMPTAKKSYKASIFSTKAAGDILGNWEFGADNDGYTTGTVGSGATIKETDGSVVNMIQHTQTNVHAAWARIPDTSDATTSALGALSISAGGYPVTYDLMYRVVSQTANNGFMAMSMADQISAWGGSGALGNFDSYIAFDPISTSGAEGVLMSFFQYYRCFNADKCYIDYSTDGSDWYQYEINVRGVDVAGNSNLLGNITTMLPSACNNQATLYLRLRWACDSNGGGAYGYWWFLDDVVITEASDDDMTLVNSQYFWGNYHMIPQDLQVPIIWNASLQNRGVNNQASVTLGINHLDANQSSISQFASLSFGPVASGEKIDTMIDGAGKATDEYGWDIIGTTPNVASAYFPTSTAGDNYVTTSHGATSVPTEFGDTILYQVTELVTSPDGVGKVAVWAPDNGILTPYAYDIDGMVQLDGDWYLSTGLGDENPSYTKPGYNLFTRFITGASIPSGWVIRGMQVVAATQYSTDATQTVTVMPGSHIAPVLYKDGDAEGGAFDSYLETGGNTYETKAEDFNYYDANMNRITRDDANFKEYMMPGEYNVINIMFPEQPELEAYSAYRLGYELVDGFFAVAGQNNNYVHHYDGDPDSVLYYVYYSYDTLLDGTVNVLKKYGNTFHPGNRLNSNVIDPEDGYIRQGSSSLPPMIRMLVGPRASYPTFRVNVECEGFEGLEGSGVYHANGATSVCGTTVNMTVGSAGSYVHAEAEPGYVVMAVIVDGDTAYKYGDGETGTDPNATHGTSSGYDLVNYDLSGAAENANITVKVIVGEEPYDEGIDEVASKVKMNLYPNPANNNVQLSIAGVSGNVNCAILDMSGRVVYNQTINAETTNNINLSSLAKGAYFVRITNKDFTKVEKLIVR